MLVRMLMDRVPLWFSGRWSEISRIAGWIALAYFGYKMGKHLGSVKMFVGFAYVYLLVSLVLGTRALYQISFKNVQGQTPWLPVALAIFLVFAVPSAIEQWRLRSSPEARARQTLEAMVKQWQNGEKKAVLQKMNEYSRELPYAKDDNRAFEF